jgi:hypothetical protein
LQRQLAAQSRQSNRWALAEIGQAVRTEKAAIKSPIIIDLRIEQSGNSGA